MDDIACARLCLGLVMPHLKPLIPAVVSIRLHPVSSCGMGNLPSGCGQRFDDGIVCEERVLDRLLCGEPDRQAFQCVDGGAVGGNGLQDAHPVELTYYADGGLPVAVPHLRELTLGGNELAWL